ncbi:phosphatidylethanolamine-binding protein [Schizothecium vesticola]|uniref:Phosphatidylethanolamine-binding protein n=1 Tax=Schizothecium vesticola TaxID=314040 RepID=A0AA40FCH8_9PEZI|nr:phosphatidylethanolamine-binding protein [Schizothecium vesticola]
MVPPTLLSALLATATLSLARTPPGFLPATTADLIVEYNGVIPLNGIEVPRNTTIPQPRLGTLTRLPGTSYAVFMIDLDIPTATPPQTSTLLHWLQTGLRPATTATRIRSPATGEELSVFLLENGTAPAAPLVPYFGPNPPARVPLAHRYVHLLVDTSGAEAEDLEVLRERARTGRGFDVGRVLEEADLDDAGEVVAGSWLVVRNPGPVANATASGTAAGTGTALRTAQIKGVETSRRHSRSFIRLTDGNPLQCCCRQK